MISNTLKHAKAKRYTISACESSDQNTPYVVISIQDDGIGFDEKTGHLGRGLKKFGIA